jgi:CHAT domain-containing protein/tetratricopeptide (TPR) repeat protein
VVVSLELAADRFLRSSLDQQEVDAALSLEDPHGETLTRVDRVIRDGEREVLVVRTGRPGSYRLVVENRADRPGTFRLRLDELRPAEAGDDRRIDAWGVLHQGLAQLEEGTPAASEAARERFLAALEAFRGLGDGAGQAAAQLQLGLLDAKANDPEEALERFGVGLSLLDEEEDPWLYGEMLTSAATALLKAGHGDEAVVRYREALELWARLGAQRERAVTLISLGSMFFDRQWYDEAREMWDQALELQRSLGDHSGEARTLYSYGFLLREEGRLDEALAMTEEARSVFRSQAASRWELLAVIQLGYLHRRLGELTQALRLYVEARVHLWGDAETADRLSLLQHLASIHLELRDKEAARRFQEQAVELARRGTSPGLLARALFQLGWILDAGNEIERAQGLFEEALETIRGGAEPTLEVLILLGLARNHRHLGRHGEAASALARAEQLLQHGKSALRQAMVAFEQGALAAEQGAVEEARTHLQDAIDLSRGAGDGVWEAHALTWLARVERRAARLEAARGHLERALELIESLRSGVESDTLRSSLLEGRFETYLLYREVLLDLHRRSPGGGYGELALAASERARARGLRELLEEAQVDAERFVDPAVRDRRRRLLAESSRVRHRLEALPGEGAGAERREDLERELAGLQDQLLGLEHTAQDNPRYRALRQPPGLSLEEAQGLLDDGTVLLEYALAEDRSTLFVITRDGLTLHDLPSVEKIRGRVAGLLGLLRQPVEHHRPLLEQRAHELFTMLLEPVAPLAAARKLIIVADGELLLLPFEALRPAPPGAAAGPRGYALDRWAISYAPSIAVLAELAAPRSAPVDPVALVAFADPALPGQERGADPGRGGRVVRSGTGAGAKEESYPPLPHAREEVAAIADLFATDEREVFVGAEARERTVKTLPELSRARVLHLASHGVLDESPAFSRLLLAPEPDGSEDGRLEVHEVFELELGADLAVLSACDTGLGKRLRGEGILGLSRAFFAAGARRLLVSLWRVADRSTAPLMVAFYREMKDGAAPAEALRRAKRELAEDPRTSHPYYWAPFILQGPDRVAGGR